MSFYFSMMIDGINHVPRLNGRSQQQVPWSTRRLRSDDRGDSLMRRDASPRTPWMHRLGEVSDGLVR